MTQNEEENPHIEQTNKPTDNVPLISEKEENQDEDKKGKQVPTLKLKFMQNADTPEVTVAKPEEKQNSLKKKWKLLENLNTGQENPSDDILIEEEDESEQSDKIIEPAIKGEPISRYDQAENVEEEKANFAPPQGRPNNPLLSSADLSENNESTYRSAASDFGIHEKRVLSPSEGSKNVTFSKDNEKPSGEETKFESPQVNPRIVQSKVNAKPFRNVAYPPTKVKERKIEFPTTSETRGNAPTVASTNITKEKSTDAKEIPTTPIIPEEVGLAPHITESESKKSPNDKVTMSVSTSTLRPVSSLSSHPSLGLSSNQAFDSHKILMSIKEKYKIAENKDPNASEYTSESPQFKASEMIKEHASSSDKPAHMSGSLKVQQLDAGDSSNKKQPQEILKESFGPVGDLQIKNVEYREHMKDFLRTYLDNRLPDHLRSYKSPARMFKTRFYQRFYDKYSAFMDEDIQIASYYDHLEHAKPSYSLTESRAKYYQSQLAETIKKSEQQISKYNV